MTLQKTAIKFRWAKQNWVSYNQRLSSRHSAPLCSVHSIKFADWPTGLRFARLTTREVTRNFCGSTGSQQPKPKRFKTSSQNNRCKLLQTAKTKILRQNVGANITSSFLTLLPHSFGASPVECCQPTGHIATSDFYNFNGKVRYTVVRKIGLAEILYR